MDFQASFIATARDICGHACEPDDGSHTNTCEVFDIVYRSLWRTLTAGHNRGVEHERARLQKFLPSEEYVERAVQFGTPMCAEASALVALVADLRAGKEER